MTASDLEKIEAIKSLKEMDGEFIIDLVIRLSQARLSFPGNKNRLAALVEEVGEVGTVIERNEGPERLRDECLDVCVTAMRLGVEGDAAAPAVPPSIFIGNYHLTRMNEDNVWIQSAMGEGGAFPLRDLEALLEKYFGEVF